MMRELLRVFAATLVLCACASVTSIPLPSELVVEVDVYSGRPNPEFAVGAADAAAIRERLRALPRATGAALPEGRLGYRGFSLKQPGRLPQVYVGSGLIVVYGSGEAEELYRDAHGLERFLIDLTYAGGWTGPPLQ
jgi:hypothetical protein